MEKISTKHLTIDKSGEGKYADMQVPASKTPRGSGDKTRGDKTPRGLKKGVGEKFPVTAATSTARPPTFLTGDDRFVSHFCLFCALGLPKAFFTKSSICVNDSEHRKQTKAQPLLCVDINLGNGQVCFAFCNSR